MYLSLKDAASVAGVSISTLRRMVKRGDLPSRRFGKLIRVPASALSLDPKEGARHE
ncbi:MAG: helix-turn-helix domain-containing protein [Candidatus Hydrogenedentes bacterium]|nr:helix-turn-helix domain-containing protein [Candidatus Hydrogenedentota bacterium]